VALLGHELGHYAGGDLRHAKIVGSALRSLGLWGHVGVALQNKGPLLRATIRGARMRRERGEHVKTIDSDRAEVAERVRDQLRASERAFLIAGKGREEIRFRWRPGRGDRSVWGSMAFDATSGDVRLDVATGKASWEWRVRGRGPPSPRCAR
jgi:hypothetical protein